MTRATESTLASVAQHEMWVGEKLGAGPAYWMPLALWLDGDLDVAALHGACDDVIDRHPVLASTVAPAGRELRQAPAARPVVTVADASGPGAVDRLISSETTAGFDLETGPLARFTIAAAGPGRHLLLVVAHHIVFDGMSTHVLVRDLARFYAARVSGVATAPEPLSFPAAAAAGRERMAAALPAARQFWARQSWVRERTSPSPAVFPGPLRPAGQYGMGMAVGAGIDSALERDAAEAASAAGVTTFEVLVAAAHALLFRYGAKDPVVAIDVTTRQRDDRDLIGPFINELPVVSCPVPGQAFRELALDIRRGLRELYQFRDVPVGEATAVAAEAVPAGAMAAGAVPAGTQPSRGPLASVSISYRRAEPDPVFPGLALEVDYMMFVGVRRPLHMHFVHSPDGLRMTLRVNPSALDAGTAQRFADGMRAVVRSAAADPDTPLAELDVMPAADRRRMLADWNDTAAAYPAEATLPAMFAAQAAATPDAVAVTSGCRSLSFARLDVAVTRLARRLLDAGLRRGDLVAVHLRRSDALLVTLLATHRAGAAYLPLDPDHPDERLAMITADARPRLLVTESASFSEKAGIAGVLLVDEAGVTGAEGADPGHGDAGHGSGALPPLPLPGELAYVIYTSGSTGQPKGVEVEHRNLANLLQAMRDKLGASPADTWLALTSPAFDISALEMYLPLVTGGRVVIAQPGAQRRPEALADLAARERVTHVQATPSVWRLLLPGGICGITALAGGEALPPDLAGELRKRFDQVINVYGPTETTIWSTCSVLSETGLDETVTIGRPVANTAVYLLDESLRPVPVGIAGELCIGGDGVARGYRGLPGRTAERFVPDPFGAPGSRLYLTGDLARWRAGGEIEFIGRRDGQVKLLGHRIELGEIEARLREHPGVRDAAVILHGNGSPDPRLVAYVVPASAAATGPGELGGYLSAILPSAMIPSAYVRLDQLPLNPVGKLDRAALPAPPARGAAEPPAAGPGAASVPQPGPGAASAPSPAPGAGLAAEVSLIWREVLDLDESVELGVDDDLFDLGGHSLLFTEITARVEERFGVEVSLDVVFDHPTVAGMVAEINRLRAAVPPARQADSQDEQAAAGLAAEVSLIWREVLDLDDSVELGVDDDLFDLGGHSLLFTEITARVEERFGVEVSLDVVFDHPTVAGMVAEINRLRAAVPPARQADSQGEQATALRPRPAGMDAPLSFAQERLWFLHQFDPDDASYNVFLVRRLRGALDVGALSVAIDGVVARHETLRTSFRNDGGEPAAVLHPAGRVPVEFIRLSGAGAAEEAERLVAERSNTPFRLEEGPPLRVTLIELAPDDHVLCVILHHIICDGVSLNVLFDEISALYQARVVGVAANLPPLPVQYGDFAWWQRNVVAQGERLERALAYWRGQLADPPQPALPARRERGAERRSRAGHAEAHEFRIPPDVTAALARISAERGATLFMMLLAAYHVLLAQRDGQSDVLAGTVWAVRSRTELEPLIGDLTDTLVLRGDLTGNPSFGELLDRTRQTVLDAHAHRDVPFERLVGELGLPHDVDRNPLLSSMLIMHSGAADITTRDGIGELRADLLDDPAHPAKFDLLLECWQAGGGLDLKFSSDRGLFAAGTARRLSARLAAIIEAIAAGLNQRVSAMRVLPAAERRQLVHDWNETRLDVAGDTVIDLIAAQAAATPDAPAVSCDGRTLTYAELMARAEAVAARLRAASTRTGPQAGPWAGPWALVAVCAEPSVAAVAAMLGILLAGAGYLPVDPDYPADRIRYALADSGAALALAPSGLRHVVPEGSTWLDIDEATEPGQGPVPRPVTRPALGDTAYVLYTSGSTGRPKGVAVPHAALANFLAGMRELLTPGQEDVWLWHTSASFDISGLELYLPLVSGGRVVIAGRQDRRDGTALARLAAAHGVTHIQATPSGWRMLLDGGIAAESVTALVGGEALPVQLARELSGRTRRLLNMYGPTETTIWSTAWEVPAQPDGVLIGRPIANTTCYVLDADGELAPAGAPGELFIGGAGVAAGYLGRPALTAERFLPDSYGGSGARLYRTGDRVRWSADGQLEFLGRSDNQVKVRGFRIELGEVEASLLQHPLVDQACVTVSGGDGGDRLVAYVVSASPQAGSAGLDSPGLDSAGLGGYLASRLPYYMLPAAFVRLDELPLTPNGKIDRRALPAPDLDQGRTTANGAPPRTATEHRVAAAFAGVLGQPLLTLSDDFFALGGHSLLATKVAAQLSAELGLPVPVRDLFDHSSVGGLAAAIDRLRAVPSAPLVPRPTGQAPPVTPGQQRLWFLQRLDPQDTTYNMYLVRRLRGPLDPGALTSAVSALTARHEALRTSFPEADGAPVAVVHPPAPVRMELVECAGADDAAQAARLAVNRMVNAPFDLAAAPPLRAGLIRLGPDDHVLCIAMHHIISDAPSLTVMFDDLARLYEAHRTGAEPGLPPLPVQFGDFAWWQRNAPGLEAAEAEAAEYWRQTLADPPVLELTGSGAQPQRGQAGMHALRVDPEVTAALERVARDRGATLFMVLLAAYQALLARQTSQPDILVGTSWATRERVELEPVVGYLTSTLVLRGDLTGDPSFAALLAGTRRAVLDALDYGDVPFERVVGDLGLPRDARNLLMPTMFILHAPASRTPALNTRAIDCVPRPGFAGLTDTQFDPEMLQPKFDLALEGWRDDDGLLLVLHYDTGLLPADQVAGYAARFELLLAGVAAAPDRRLSAIPLLTDADRTTLAVSAHGPAAPDAGTGVAVPSVPLSFAAAAARTPGAPAVTCGAETISYARLQALAGRLTAELAGAGLAGAGHSEVVGVCLPRSPAAIAAPLAVWGAGAAYLPLDPSYPDERLAALLAASAARCVITSVDLAPRLGRLRVPATLLVVPPDALPGAAPQPAAPGPDAAPSDPAYLIYTSGSTGQPNGVLVEHGALAARVAWMTRDYQLGPGDVVAQFASMSFDTHAEEIYPALVAGAALLLLPDGPASLPDVLRTEPGRAVTVLDLPTAYWHRLTEMIDDVAWPDGLRLVILGGEQVHATAVARWRARFGDRVRLVNTYGPTEATIIATAGDLGAADTAGRPGIGRPISQTTAYVLNRDGQQVPPGVPGELCLGGAGLARGYLGDPARTADRFVPDPYGPPGSRLYRTGDRVRWRADRTLEFLGRLDNQVKVRGFRVEPGEVEAALMAHPAVGQAAVVAAGERLVAYLTSPHMAGTGDSQATAEELRRHLAQHLPAHLIPSAFVTLDALPLTVNGKVDSAALPTPPPERAAVFAAPQTDAELLVAAIWTEVLPAATGPIGAGDDFFALGGHSLLAARVAARLRTALELEVPIRALFDYPVLADLATAVEDLLVAEIARLTDDEAAALMESEAS